MFERSWLVAKTNSSLTQDIEDLRKSQEFDAETDAISIKRIQDRHSSLVKYTEQLEQRVSRLEIVCEGLIWLFKEQGQLTDEMLEIIVARIDLADGVEDGKKGTEGTQAKYTCPHCGRPANPRRETCVFCFQALPKTAAIAAAAATKPTVALVGCAICGKEVPKRETNFTESGIACQSCYAQNERG
jgi:hypothetical protein